jgi:hypothetical protein
MNNNAASRASSTNAVPLANAAAPPAAPSTNAAAPSTNAVSSTNAVAPPAPSTNAAALPTNAAPSTNAAAPPAALPTNTASPTNAVSSINTTTKAPAPPASTPVVAAATNVAPVVNAKTTPVVAASVVAAPVVAAAANAVTNAKNEEICFIYSNALTKGTFKKGCIVVYKGNKTSSDRSADMLQQLRAQKDLQVVKGGVQTSFVQSINDKTSLFIAYVEVMNAPTDKQIEEMKASISKAIRQPSPTKGGKRFHTKKRHAKKKTTRRRS